MSIYIALNIESNAPMTGDGLLDMLSTLNDDGFLADTAAMTSADSQHSFWLRLHTEHDEMTQALADVNRLMRDLRTYLACSLLEVRLLSDQNMDASLAEPLVPELVGRNEIASMAGLSISRIQYLTDSETFPRPVTHLAHGSIYLKSAVASWLADNTESAEQ